MNSNGPGPEYLLTSSEAEAHAAMKPWDRIVVSTGTQTLPFFAMTSRPPLRRYAAFSAGSSVSNAAKMCPGVVMAAERIPTDSRSEQSSAVVSLQSPVRLYSVILGKWTVSMISALPRAFENGASRFCT